MLVSSCVYRFCAFVRSQVCHMVNGKTKPELQLSESNWSHQFHMAKFQRLAAAGVTLQNIVYYRSTGAFAPEATHYVRAAGFQPAPLAPPEP